MGSGKTTVGRLLARQLRLDFIDLDEVIECRLNMRVEEIFSRFGEGYFRSVESQVVRDVLSGVSNAVIACGGGAVLRDDNVEFLRKYSVVVYLRISGGEAYKRLVSCDGRPLLKVSDRRGVIESLLRFREPLYLRAAHIVVDVDGRSPEEVVSSIINSLPEEVVVGVRTY